MGHLLWVPYFKWNSIHIHFRLTHWGRVTHIGVSNLTIIGSDNGLSPGRRHAIIWSNAGILLIRNLGIKFREILSKIHTFSFKKMHFKMFSAKWRQVCLGFNVLRCCRSARYSTRTGDYMTSCTCPILWGWQMTIDCAITALCCISMTKHKTAVTPLPTHWSYHSLAPSHQYDFLLMCCHVATWWTQGSFCVCALPMRDWRLEMLQQYTVHWGNKDLCHCQID